MKVIASLILSLACFITCVTASAAPEKVYKWTDAKGQTHYGQRPPSNTQTEVIKTQTGHSDPVNYDAGGNATATASDEKKVEAKEAPPKDKERCEAARKNSDTLKTYARIKVKGDDGQYRYLTEEEQKQKLLEATKAIEESCD